MALSGGSTLASARGGAKIGEKGVDQAGRSTCSATWPCAAEAVNNTPLSPPSFTDQVTAHPVQSLPQPPPSKSLRATRSGEVLATTHPPPSAWPLHPVLTGAPCSGASSLLASTSPLVPSALLTGQHVSAAPEVEGVAGQLPLRQIGLRPMRGRMSQVGQVLVESKGGRLVGSARTQRATHTCCRRASPPILTSIRR